MADFATYAQAANRSAMLANLRTSRAVSAAAVAAPAPVSTAAAPAANSYQQGPTSEIELQLQQMRLQNLQLQEHLLMQQAQAQATAQQYAVAQQRWLQQQLAGQMMQRSAAAAYYGGGAAGLQDHLAAQQQAQLLALLGGGGQQGEDAWDENQEAAAERAWVMEQLGARGAAQEVAPDELAHLTEAQQEAILRARLIAAAQGHAKQSSSLGSTSSSTARLSSSPPPTLVLSRPDEAFPVFAADDKQTPRMAARAGNKDQGHRHQNSLSSTSSSEGGDSSGSGEEYGSATTAGTNVSAFDDDKRANVGLGRPSAAGLTAALSGAGQRPHSRPGSSHGQGSLNPFAASFAPSAPNVAAGIFAPVPVGTPMTAVPVPQTATPFRVQSSPNPVGVLTAIPVRAPKGPASEADLPSKNFAGMARKRNLGLLGRRNPSSPTAASGFAAQQDAGFAQARSASLQVPGLYVEA